MDALKLALARATQDRNLIVLWLKGGGKISGRIISLEDDHLLLDISGEMAEFQSYNAFVLMSEISAVAWVVQRE